MSEDRDVLDLQSLVSTEWGRRLAMKLITDTGFWGSQFSNEERLDAYLMGQREVGRRMLLSIREHAPGSFLAMLDEDLRRELEEKAKADKEKGDGSSSE